MTILNIITYTQQDSAGNIHEIEQRLSRGYKLTRRGALRIIKAAGVRALSVIRVETFIDER
jgi:hypothetical protein